MKAADIIRQSMDVLALSAIRSKYEVVLVALNEQLGQWDMQKIRARCETVVYPDGTEEFRLDGEPIMLFEPSVFDFTDEGVKVTFNYRSIQKKRGDGV